MKRKVLLMMIAIMLAIMSGACKAELSAIPGNQSVVDYSGSPNEWIHIPETEDTTIADVAVATNAGQITVPAAEYTQDPVTGEWIIEPGVSVITVTGTV
mgnify:CR=1 FL=1